MSDRKFQQPPIDVVSKLRRANEVTKTAHRFGLVVNDDGSVFDQNTRKRFSSIVDWSEEASVS